MSKVYFLDFNQKQNYKDFVISGLKNIIVTNDFTAIKMHFGEKNNKGFIKPEWVKPVAKIIKACGGNPFLTDASTIYVGERSNAVCHTVIAKKHGFTIANCDAPIIIADGLRGNNYVEVEIRQKHFQKVKISQAIYYSDSIVFLSHFKGHELSGFGGALKNIGMGCGAKAGKYEMHHSVLPKVIREKCTACKVCLKWCPAAALFILDGKISIDNKKCVGCGECILSCPQGAIKIVWDESIKNVQEKIVEYALGVLKTKTNKCYYLNFLNFITPQCDCYPTKVQPLVDDIGILASLDPVAIDQASIDLVNQKAQADIFRKVYPQVDWHIQLDYAQSLGLGEKQYELVNWGIK